MNLFTLDNFMLWGNNFYHVLLLLVAFSQFVLRIFVFSFISY